MIEETAVHHGKEADGAAEGGDEADDEDPVPDALMHYRHQ